MTSKLTRERIELIANFHRAMTLPPSHAEIEELARMALAAMDSEPVAYISKSDFNAGYPHILARRDFNKACTMAVYAAQPAPVVPENCVTAEHRRVIEMLLSVCGAAFELADDSCQQDVDGEECHVVPSDAFQKLSDALDEIENTLPTEDTDRPDVFLVWSAVPRAALKSILHAQPAQVVPEGLRMALSNAGIAAPESDEMLAATHEKYVQALVMWVRDRKPFQPAQVVPDDVLDALQKVARIRLDLNDFDGDRRGIADCLCEAEEALIEVVNRRAAMLSGGKS